MPQGSPCEVSGQDRSGEEKVGRTRTSRGWADKDAQVKEPTVTFYLTFALTAPRSRTSPPSPTASVRISCFDASTWKTSGEVRHVLGRLGRSPKTRTRVARR